VVDREGVPRERRSLADGKTITCVTSKRTDRLQKRLLYHEERVPDYWIVDPELRRVERWRASATEPELLTDRLEWAPSLGVPPLELDLRTLFGKISR
jgi:Uma2 family endonuclease